MSILNPTTIHWLKKIIGTSEKQPEPVSLSSPLPVNNGTNTSAFGDQSVSELTPVAQLEFSYDLNPWLINDLSNKGTASIDSSRLKLSTGAAANQSALVRSIEPVKYNAGQGSLFRFSAVFTSGVAGSEQIIGGGGTDDGLCFGYNGADFGIIRRSFGSHEVRVFTVTTASTTAENVTVTLNGNAVSVPVTNSGVITTTANEIAAYDYSDIGTGWTAHVEGEKVEFISTAASPFTGSFSLTATTAVASVSTSITGVDPTDSWILQTSWNKDKADGTGELPLIDFTKGNVFQIQLKWLGFGSLNYFIEHPVTGKMVLVHRIEYANTVTIPSIGSPTFHLFGHVKNTTNTTDIILYTSSLAGFTEGRKGDAKINHGASSSVSQSVGTFPVLTIHNKLTYASKINKNMIRLMMASMASDGTKTVNISFYVNATLTAASFVDVDANSSVSYDVSATAVTGGEFLFSTGLGRSDSQNINVSNLNFTLPPGNKLTMVSTSTGATDIDGSFNFKELF